MIIRKGQRYGKLEVELLVGVQAVGVEELEQMQEHVGLHVDDLDLALPDKCDVTVSKLMRQLATNTPRGQRARQVPDRIRATAT